MVFIYKLNPSDIQYAALVPLLSTSLPPLFILLPSPVDVKLLSSQAARSECVAPVICLLHLYNVCVCVCVNVRERGRESLTLSNTQTAELS